MKICGKCKQEKDSNLFYSDKGKKDGLSAICKQCNKEYKSRPEVKERKNKNRRDKMQSNPELRERINAKKREKYHESISDPERKEQIKQSKSAWYEQNKDAVIQRAKEWSEDNQDKLKIIRKKNREKYKEQRSEYNKEWAAANPDKVKERKKRYITRNPHVGAAYCRRRDAGKLQATPAWANSFFIQEVYHLAKLRTMVTGVIHHVDHIVPLRSKLVCGLHNEFNLQVIPATDNLKKSNTWWPDMPEPEQITKAA